MANHPSALKAQRQNTKRRTRNKSHQSALKSTLKRVSGLVKGGKAEEAQKVMPGLYSKIDRAVQKKALSKNAAARHKSRLTRHLNAALQASKQ